MAVINEYFSALKRLEANTPVRLPKGSPINKDTVALEAGRKRGSIKKSRSSFTELIAAIDKASQDSPVEADSKTLIANVRSQKDNYRKLYLEALNRELMLIERLAQLEKIVKNFDNVVPLSER
ncbi:MAG: hypothetical protein HOM11_05625 [Methylococcales bacterium]|jgi:hypothetical protein|nr:hypothetical protein [Methylococcales bacterium]MBT7445640.1 hypothetical protein [Methylococcales bacterium]